MNNKKIGTYWEEEWAKNAQKYGFRSNAFKRSQRTIS